MILRTTNTMGLICLVMAVIILSCHSVENNTVKDSTSINIAVDTSIIIEKSASEEVFPPPPIQDVVPTDLATWFWKMANAQMPDHESVDYRFVLFESPTVFSIYFNEVDSSSKNATADNYAYISRDAYKGMKWYQVLDKIRDQLTSLAATARFRHSKLAEAKEIVIHFDDNKVLKLK